MTAVHWSAAVTEISGGKTGGREPTRQGAGSEPEKLEEAVSKAEKWVQEKLEKLKI